MGWFWNIGIGNAWPPTDDDERTSTSRTPTNKQVCTHIVEGQGAQRGAEVGEPPGGPVEHPALVGGRDDEDAHAGAEKGEGRSCVRVGTSMMLWIEGGTVGPQPRVSQRG